MDHIRSVSSCLTSRTLLAISTSMILSGICLYIGVQYQGGQGISINSNQQAEEENCGAAWKQKFNTLEETLAMANISVHIGNLRKSGGNHDKHAHSSLAQHLENRTGYQYPTASDDKLIDFLAALEHRLPWESVAPPSSKWLHQDKSWYLAWFDPELHLWLRAQAWMLTSSRGNYLDVGCGMGRIIRKFRWIFDATTCLEADPERIAEARKTEEWVAGGPVMYHNVRFLSFQSLPESYDVISCIHVIQHIPIYELTPWLQSMRNLLKPKGVLILATTLESSTSLTVHHSSGQDPKVSIEKFNEIAATPGADVLPVHGFTDEELRKLISSSGFHVLEQSGFAFLNSGRALSQFVIAAKTALPRQQSLLPTVTLDQVYTSRREEVSLLRCRDLKRRKGTYGG